MKPKYEIGEKVWMIDDSKAVEKEIVAIRKNYKDFDYYFSNELFFRVVGVPETNLFPTKEDLIKSLIDFNAVDIPDLIEELGDWKEEKLTQLQNETNQ